jgi:hypothetical protein
MKHADNFSDFEVDTSLQVYDCYFNIYIEVSNRFAMLLYGTEAFTQNEIKSVPRNVVYLLLFRFDTLKTQLTEPTVGHL